MGIETEYGVLQEGRPLANPMLMSSQIVTTYRALAQSPAGQRARARWDYDDEDPLADARGFRLDRASAHPSLLTDDPTAPAPSGDGEFQQIDRPRVEEYDDPSAANAILTNGARLYVDHAHPEYSSPEVLTPLDAVRWDVAGERVVLASSRSLAEVGIDVVPYKNNVDGKGASYGTHENFLVDRALPFADLVDGVTPFLVTRQVFAGAGRVGIGPSGQQPGFQMSQRADYMEAEVGLETTLRRPIVNTRDEPHADRERWRRLHLIIGDANLLETATYLKMGTTSLVLWVLENLAALADAGIAVHERLASLRLADPVGDTQRVSRDLDLGCRLALAGGGTATALEVQRAYLDLVMESLAALGVEDEETSDVVRRWGSVLDRLGRDLAECARDVEWVAKLRLLDRMRRRDDLAWDHPRLAALDLQWSDVRPERGVYHRLLAAGAVDRLVDEGTVARAVHHAPTDTRAYFRGEVVARYPDAITAASWDSVVFDVPGARALQRVPMMDPHRGTRAHLGALLDASDDVGSLLAGLSGTA